MHVYVYEKVTLHLLSYVNCGYPYSPFYCAQHCIPPGSGLNLNVTCIREVFDLIISFPLKMLPLSHMF